LMAKDETRALAILEENRTIHQRIIDSSGGDWLKEMGDGVLASFSSSSDALKCAREILSSCKSSGIELRIGIHLGEVLFQRGDVFGDGVNIASRVESLAVPGSILFTERVHDDIRNKPDLEAVSIGQYTFKNIGRPLEVYALAGEGLVIPDPDNVHGKLEYSGHTTVAVKKPVTYWKVIIGILAATVITTILGREFFISQSWITPSATQEVRSDEHVTIAALPFSNISGEQESDFLGFALVDQVISSLSYLKNIVVRPSSSIRKYDKQVVDPQEVSRALDVQYILMGHYVKNLDSLRLNLELIDINQNEVLWRESVKEKMEDAFRLQDRVANKVIEGLKIQFSTDEQSRMTKDIPKDPLAYEYYLRSLDFQHSVDENRMAMSMVMKSIELDSTFAPAFVALGNRQYQLARYSLDSEEDRVIQDALAAYNYALELNSEHLGALRDLSFLLTELDDKDQALKLAKRMISINPNNAHGHFSLSYVYRYTGLIEEAIKSMEIGLQIASRDRQFRSAGVTYTLAGRYQDAIRVLEFDDGSGFAEGWKGLTFIRLRDTISAIRELEIATKKDPGDIFETWTGSMLGAIRRAPADWVSRIRKVESTVRDPESMYSWSITNILLGDYEYALELIEKSVDGGYYPYSFFLIDPLLDPVRDTERFRGILEKAKEKHEAFKVTHSKSSFH
ncbi:MAG: hypothetical protein OEQ53_22190, partial [Saprospiraceae bacterium]|nr:hypothetical protein [Saprospiraceae bacterium]